MASCDPNELMRRAAGLVGLDPFALATVKTQLLCNFADAIMAMCNSDFSWTPTTTDIYPQFAYTADTSFTGVDTLAYAGATAQGFNIRHFSMVTLNFPNLTTCPLFDLEFGANLTTLTAPVLAACAKGFTVNSTKIPSLNLPLLVNAKLGFNLNTNTLLTTVNLPLLTDAHSGFNAVGNAIGILNLPNLTDCFTRFRAAAEPNLTSISIPSVTGTVTQFVITGNPLLTVMTLPATLTTANFDGSACALNQATVDAVLSGLVAGGQNNGTCALDGGTNATPSVAGLVNKATLVGNGWTVTNN